MCSFYIIKEELIKDKELTIKEHTVNDGLHNHACLMVIQITKNLFDNLRALTGCIAIKEVDKRSLKANLRYETDRFELFFQSHFWDLNSMYHVHVKDGFVYQFRIET